MSCQKLTYSLLICMSLAIVVLMLSNNSFSAFAEESTKRQLSYSIAQTEEKISLNSYASDLYVGEYMGDRDFQVQLATNDNAGAATSSVLTKYSDTVPVVRGELFPEYGHTHEYQVKIMGKIRDGGQVSYAVYEKKRPDTSLLDGIKWIANKNREFSLEFNLVRPLFKLNHHYIVEINHGDNIVLFEFVPTQRMIETAAEYRDGAPRQVKVIDFIKAKMPNKWIVNLKMCSGSEKAERPIHLTVQSDKEIIRETIPKSISAGSCGRETMEVRAIHPGSITADFANFGGTEMPTKADNVVEGKTSQDSNLVKLVSELVQQNKGLREDLKNKNEIIMKQIQVIQDLIFGDSEEKQIGQLIPST